MPPVNPQDVTVLVIEDNLNNFLLMARLLAFVGVGALRVEGFWLAGTGVRRDTAAHRPDLDGYFPPGTGRV